jgi:glycosyltransferase involved in cell wall biosynthesis
LLWRAQQWDNSAVKTIGIDCRFAGGNSGLGRFTRCIVEQLLIREDNVRYVLFVRSSTESWISELPRSANTTLFPANIAHYSLAEQLYFPGMLRRSGIDLLFAPHFNVPLRCPVPFVATIHDLILHGHAAHTGLLRRSLYRVQMSHTVRSAKHIIAVSAFTALEIGGAYGPGVLAKCTVTGEGVEEVFSPPQEAAVVAARSRYRLPDHFFLYVGSAKPHKNVEMLLEAFASQTAKNRSLVLVLPPGACLETKPPGVHVLHDVPTQDLPSLYGAADCFVTASTNEGFCLPLAEALCSGCPAIAVNRTAITETAHGAAMLVEPTTQALRTAMQDPPRRPVHYPRPSWKVAAARIAAVLTKSL